MEAKVAGRKVLKAIMPPTKTIQSRSVELELFTLPGYKIGGMLTICCQETPTRKIDRRVFAVLEQDYNKGRCFKLTKPGVMVEDDTNTYYVTLAERPEQYDGCGCKAKVHTGTCSHSVALRCLSNARLLPPHAGVPPTFFIPTKLRTAPARVPAAPPPVNGRGAGKSSQNRPVNGRSRGE